MPLVKAQCTNCNGMLEVDSSKDAAICPHCGTPYIVEKAVNQYVTNNYFGSSRSTESDSNRQLAYQFLEEKEYEKAVKAFGNCRSMSPDDYYHLIKAYTHDFSLEYFKQEANKSAEYADSNWGIISAKQRSYSSSARVIESYLDRIPHTEQYSKYISKVEPFCKALQELADEQHNMYEQKSANLRQSMDKSMDDWKKKKRIGAIIAICVALIGVVLLASGEMGGGMLGLLMLLAGGPYAIFSIKDLIKN